MAKKGSSLELSFLLFLLTALFIAALLAILSETRVEITYKHKSPLKYPLNCTSYNHNKQCLFRPTFLQHEEDEVDSSPHTCPEYFRWIHEDLRPWTNTGITKDMVERARYTANFKLVILKGKAYVEIYGRPYQTRDIFSMWGILQLLKRYPGKIPDLELMFRCEDLPAIFAHERNMKHPPALFGYYSSHNNLEILFPDWSYWGWYEINIKPWQIYLDDMKKVNEKLKWLNKEPYAYWKGNPTVNKTREDLLTCNVSDHQDWSARLYNLDWDIETKEGFKTTELTTHCNYRYKIYVEGYSWSNAAKYVLACNSVTLYVTTFYYEFFTRGLMPLHHYWPIREDDKCRSLQFAVQWGNNYSDKAEAIGKSGSNFVQQELTMEYVYDYMFHVLNAYAQLLKFKPSISEYATELCEETLICEADEVRKKYFMDTKVNATANINPCTMPPPFDPVMLQDFLSQKENSTKQVELWKENYWNNDDGKELYRSVFENDFEEI